MPSSSQSHWRQLISHRELVMSVMADSSKKYFLIHWQLLSHSYSVCCLELCWIAQIHALIKSSCGLVHKGPTSKLVFCWCFPLLYVHFIRFIWSHKTDFLPFSSIFFPSSIDLQKVSRVVQLGQGKGIGEQKCPSLTKHLCLNNMQQNLMHVCSWEQGGRSTHTLRCWQHQSSYQPWSLGYRACGIALMVGNHFTSWKNWLWVSMCAHPLALLSHLVCVWLYFQVRFEHDTLCPHDSACMYFEVLRNCVKGEWMYSIFRHKIKKAKSYLNGEVSEQWIIHFFCMTQKDLMFSGRISFVLSLHF